MPFHVYRLAQQSWRAVLAISLLAAPGFPASAQSPADVGPKVIYGTDDRIDVFQETDPDRLMYAASTCALIRKSSMAGPVNGQFTVTTTEYLNGNGCEGEAFLGQRTAPFCSGFLVGPDLIASAGHCVDAGSPNTLDGAEFYFVFGYDMLDANTLRTTFDANQVYEGVETISRMLNNQTAADYSIIRLDRAVSAPGAVPLSIRRTGTLAVGTPVGVIGHPTGLPKKIAFGSDTLVRDVSNSVFFMANLDTYGGNSGSPVFNQDTGIVEGILVRGQTDFINQGGCTRSNVLPNTEADSEDVTRTSVFDEFIPLTSNTASFQLSDTALKPSDTLPITVMDSDIAGMGPVQVMVSATGGDAEVVSLTETTSGTFAATLTLTPGAVTQDDGILQAADGETITLSYDDDSNASGNAQTIEATVAVDGTVPTISNVMTQSVAGNSVTVSFTTSEPAFASVHVGLTCGTFTNQADGMLATNHSITVSGLLPITNYVYSIMVSDAASNGATGDNGGQCFAFTTLDEADSFTELFTDTGDLQGKSITFVPDGEAFSACVETVSDFWVNPDCGTALTLTDDDSAAVSLTSGHTFQFFGQTYTQFFVGSNGYVTFGAGDEAFAASLGNHFDLPRVSAHFTDLDPESGGRVAVTELSDRVAISYDDVPYIDSVLSASFQIELFFDGGIRITWITLDPEDSWIAGLSDGGGVPTGDGSDLSAYGVCTISVYGEGACTPTGTVSCFAASGDAGFTLAGLAGDGLLLLVAALSLLLAPSTRRAYARVRR